MLFDPAMPIYIQIMEDFKKKMIRGELKTGDKILSQREYAKLVKVNPNTVQRAYREMEMLNLVETLRGQGTFVSVTSAKLGEIKKEMAQDFLNTFISEMKDLNYSNEEIINLLKEAFKEGEQE